MGRLSTLIKAEISKLLDRAEKPGETLDYAYEKQVEQIQVIRKGIVDVVAAKKRLQTHATKLEQQVQKLDIQARTAIRVGREDLARMAIERKQLIIVESGSLSQQIAELEHQQRQMIASESQLRTKVEAFRSRKEVVKAQYSAAEAQVRISEAARGIGSDMADVGLAMQRAIDNTETMRARANAVQELEAAGTFEDLAADRAATGRHRPCARAARSGQRRRCGPGAAQGRARSANGTATHDRSDGWSSRGVTSRGMAKELRESVDA